MNEGMTEGTRVYVWCVSESLSHIYLDSPLKCCDFCSLSLVLLPIDLFRSVLQKSVDWFFFSFLLCQVQKAGGLLGVTSRGLLILGLLLVFILILLVIIVVLAALWPRTKAQEAPKVCDTPACLRAAAQVFFFLFFFFAPPIFHYFTLVNRSVKSPGVSIRFLPLTLLTP